MKISKMVNFDGVDDGPLNGLLANINELNKKLENINSSVNIVLFGKTRKRTDAGVMFEEEFVLSLNKKINEAEALMKGFQSLAKDTLKTLKKSLQ